MGLIKKLLKRKPKEILVETVPATTDWMPVVPYRVLHNEIPFYSDPECKQEVPDAKIVILEALDPDDSYKELDVLPTLKKYEIGQLVDWNLNNKRIWEKSWYQNPETTKIERAWILHIEFVGNVVSENCIEKNRTLLKEIGARTKKSAE